MSSTLARLRGLPRAGSRGRSLPVGHRLPARGPACVTSAGILSVGLSESSESESRPGWTHTVTNSEGVKASESGGPGQGCQRTFSWNVQATDAVMPAFRGQQFKLYLARVTRRDTSNKRFVTVPHTAPIIIALLQRNA